LPALPLGAGAHGEQRDEIDVRGRETTEQLAPRVLHLFRDVRVDAQVALALLQHGPLPRLEEVAGGMTAPHEPTGLRRGPCEPRHLGHAQPCGIWDMNWLRSK